MLIAFGVLRTPWLVLLPFAPSGVPGMLLIVLVQTRLMVAVGVFNPSFATYRMEATEDGFMSRVYSSWSISSRCGQPLFIAVGGVLAGLTSLRTAMLVAGFCCLVSAFILPWRVTSPTPAPLPEPV